MTDYQYRPTLHQSVMKLALSISTEIRDISTGGVDPKDIKAELIHRRQ